MSNPNQPNGRRAEELDPKPKDAPDAADRAATDATRKVAEDVKEDPEKPAAAQR